MPTRRFEITTAGINPNLQLVGSSPNGGPVDIGLQIGSNGGSTSPGLRQLFCLAVAKVDAHEKIRVVGFRQMISLVTNITIGGIAANGQYPLEMQVLTPFWKFVDGNVLWSIQRVVEGEQQTYPSNLDGPGPNGTGLMFRYSRTPSQLFESIAGSVITPPNGGMPWGRPLSTDLGAFWDLKNDWKTPTDTDIEVEGPCDVAFFASIQQTNPGTRTSPVAESTFSTLFGVTPEDAFVQFSSQAPHSSGAVYGRVAGSLIFEKMEWAGETPKTYLLPSDGDRLTSDESETGTRSIARPASETSGRDSGEGQGGRGGDQGGGQRGGGDQGSPARSHPGGRR